MPRSTYPKDSFDDLPADGGRVGAHRAENPRLRTGVVVAWAALAAVVLLGIGIVGTLAVTGRLTGAAPTQTPTASASPHLTPVIDTSYSVLVLNATGQPGRATDVTDQIVQAGWARDSVSPGEAGSTFPTTTVYYASAADAPAAAGLAKVIGGAQIAQSDKYQQSGSTPGKQLTVVLGTDRVATPAPTKTP